QRHPAGQRKSVRHRTYSPHKKGGSFLPPQIPHRAAAYLPRQELALSVVQTSRPVYSGSLSCLPLLRSSRRCIASLPISNGRWPTWPSDSPSFSCCICMSSVSADTNTSCFDLILSL